ncbi:MAG: hypothetical protein ACYDEV_00165 [Acidiferrobacter sp.]
MKAGEAIRAYVAQHGLLTRWRRTGPELDAAYEEIRQRLLVRQQETQESRDHREPPPPAALLFVWPTLTWTVLRSWQDASWTLIAMMLPAALYLVKIAASGIATLAWTLSRWLG